MDNFKLAGFPLIFPKLTGYLLSEGVSIHVTGKMGTDYQLNAVIMNFLISKEWKSLPDVTYYNKSEQRWIELHFNAEINQIDLGRQGKLLFSKQMYELQGSTEIIALCDYLRLNSGGTFTTSISEAKAI